MGRIQFIAYKDKRILLADLTNCSGDEVAAVANELPEFVTLEPLDSVLLLADFSGAQFSRESVERVKIAAVFDRSHLKRAAWVLTENLPTALYDSIRSFSAREIPVFATRDEALDYLVS